MGTFKDDDQGFLHGKATHDGFVVNTTRQPRSDYLMLHRASCPHLGSGQAKRHWTKEYIKVCSIRLKDLERWAEGEVGPSSRLEPCHHCKPRAVLAVPSAG